MANLLAGDREVTEIAIAARDFAVAKRVCSEIGSKAVALEADATDEARLARIVEPYDLVINTAGPDFRVALPAVRAAIGAGTHYCDIAADAPSTEAALALDGPAKDAGITALTGIGHMPGVSNLLVKHAANQLDALEEARVCVWYALSRENYTVFGDPKEMRASGRVSASWQTILAWLAGRVRTYSEGRWADVDPFDHPVVVSLPGGASVSAYPVGSSEAVTLPRHLPGVRSVEVLLGLDPPQLVGLLRAQAQRLALREADAATAALTFVEAIASDPERWVGGERRIPPGFGMVASAHGSKGGRRVRYSCWPATAWDSTVGPLATAARGILKSHIRKRGVFAPEMIFDPIPFLQEASRFGPEPPPRGALLRESTDPLG
jgi:lysine 6-dehydrogenase